VDWSAGMGLMVGAIIGSIGTPLVLHRLNTERLNRWLMPFLGVIISYFWLADAGLGIRYQSASHHNRGFRVMFHVKQRWPVKYGKRPNTLLIPSYRGSRWETCFVIMG